MDFALDWPRLGEGGLALLEEFLKTHPNLRLVVIDTWARVAPPAGKHRTSQYEGDYEALIPLKRLADTYRVSILAVHHLRKTGSSDVLDEITGSIGMTGAVDGTLILKRERGQADASLFVTGRDIEHEQHLAMSFDATTALWSVIGNAEEVGRTRARQQPEGMSPREIAEALEKNYHTTRSLLRKMEETGEIMRQNARYLALSEERNLGHIQPTQKSDQIKQGKCQQTMCLAIPRGEGCDDQNGSAQSDASDYTDYTDDGNDTSADSCVQASLPREAAALQKAMKSSALCQHEAHLQGEHQQQELAVISVINRNQCNQSDVSVSSVEGQGILPCGDQTAGAEHHHDASPHKTHCPHHPRAQRVRFDPAGQAWCDRMECWDCYRLMKIGEVPEVPP